MSKNDSKRKERKAVIEKYLGGLFARTEGYARNVSRYYTAAVEALLDLAATADMKPDEVFHFSDHRRMSVKATNILRGLYSAVYQEIRRGVRAEWEYANLSADAMITSLFGKGVMEDNHFARWFARNQEAMDSFFSRKDAHGGLNLSQKVWKYTGQLKEEMELALSASLGQGDSASTVSRHVRQYLREPDRLFRRVRDAQGNLKLSKRAAAYHPGRGEYRSSYKNAMRLTRTETNMAYRAADCDRWSRIPFVVGMEVKRSNHPFGCEVCEALKGKYPKDFVFTGWHPQCRCYIVPVLASEEERMAYHRAILNGEDVSDFHFKGEITEPHEGFQKWMKENQERIENAKSLPYWIKGNGKYVGVKQTSQAEAVSNNSIFEPVKSWANTVVDRSSDRQIHEKEVLGFLNEKLGGESVNGAFDGFHIDRWNFEGSIMRTVTRKMDDGSYRQKILISNTSSKVIGADGKTTTFNAMRELQGAMEAIKNKQPLTFNQEYALESVWHELRHAKAKNWKVLSAKHPDSKVAAMEVVNQLCARRTYADFLKRMGVEARHYEAVLKQGYGYKQEITNLRTIFEKFNINEVEFFRHFENRIIVNDYDMIFDNMVKYLRGRKVKNVEVIIQKLGWKAEKFNKFMGGI